MHCLMNIPSSDDDDDHHLDDHHIYDDGDNDDDDDDDGVCQYIQRVCVFSPQEAASDSLWVHTRTLQYHHQYRHYYH